MRGNHVVIIICLVLLGCSTYTVDYKLESRSVSIESDSTKIYTSILLKPSKYELKNNLQYHWYSNDLLGANYGGFNGYLLNGYYKKLNLKGNLIEQGSFSDGLKDGVWKYWYANGNLKRLEKWVKGVKKSNVEDYDIDGKLIISQNKASATGDQPHVDSTNTKAPWYKKIFKKHK